MLLITETYNARILRQSLPSVVFLNGPVLFVAGLAAVRAHSVWVLFFARGPRHTGWLVGSNPGHLPHGLSRASCAERFRHRVAVAACIRDRGLGGCSAVRNGLPMKGVGRSGRVDDGLETPGCLAWEHPMARELHQSDALHHQPPRRLKRPLALGRPGWDQRPGSLWTAACAGLFFAATAGAPGRCLVSSHPWICRPGRATSCGSCRNRPVGPRTGNLVCLRSTP